MLNDLTESFWSRLPLLLEVDGCWVWEGAVQYRRHYGMVPAGRGNRKLAHRVSWELHFGPIPPRRYVCHSCDNPPCCNPAHLWLGTAKDNAQDRERKGRSNRTTSRARGVNHPRSILDDNKVRKIRSRYEAGELASDIARDFGVSQGTIANVAHRRTWKHVDEVPSPMVIE